MPKISKSKKEIVAERARYCCEYCLSQARFSGDYFGVDHIFPTALGGNDNLENLALCCSACNDHKYIFVTGFDPQLSGEAPLYNPRLDTWAGHFRWSEGFELLIGLTSTGRATIKRLKLNRPYLVNQRALYVSCGRHPPY